MIERLDTRNSVEYTLRYQSSDAELLLLQPASQKIVDSKIPSSGFIPGATLVGAQAKSERGFCFMGSKRICGTPLERFWAKVKIDTKAGCWLWTGALFENSQYAVFSADGTAYAHIWSFCHYRGPVPKGKELHHQCHVRHCANPWHVEPKTKLEHVAEHYVIYSGPIPVSIANGRTYKRPTKCKHGHEFTTENTQLTIRKEGGGIRRGCRECNRARSRACRNSIRTPQR